MKKFVLIVLASALMFASFGCSTRSSADTNNTVSWTVNQANVAKAVLDGPFLTVYRAESGAASYDANTLPLTVNINKATVSVIVDGTLPGTVVSASGSRDAKIWWNNYIVSTITIGVRTQKQADQWNAALAKAPDVLPEIKK